MTTAKTFTIAICSYQRKDALLRLLTELDAQARTAPADWEGIDVVVVIDGSTDGSAKAASELATLFQLQVISQPNAGLSAARNACLAHASGELIYFLDDDLVPAEGTVLRHRHAQRDPDVPLVLGPQVFPAGFTVPESLRWWWDDLYRELEQKRVIDRFDRFSIANSSGPTEAFRSVAGFDEGFTGYGLEDYEIGLRLMEAGVFERYDGEAIAWHYNTADEHLALSRTRETGRNAVRLLRRHPQATSALLPDRYGGPPPWALDRSHLRSPRLLAGVAWAAQWLAPKTKGVSARLEGYLRWLATASMHSAGVADMDRSLVPSFLGRPTGQTTGRLWHREPTPVPTPLTEIKDR